MARVPDLPCASCGKLMWSGTTSLPAGKAKCQPCRRADWKHGTRKGYRDKKCRCAACSEWAANAVRQYRSGLRARGVRLPGGSGPWINPAVRAAVFERDEWRCQLCQGPTDPDADPQSDWFPSLDHIIPKSKGGSHTMENLRTAHRWCNSIRGSQDYHAYLFEEAS